MKLKKLDMPPDSLHEAASKSISVLAAIVGAVTGKTVPQVKKCVKDLVVAIEASHLAIQVASPNEDPDWNDVRNLLISDLRILLARLEAK